MGHEIFENTYKIQISSIGCILFTKQQLIPYVSDQNIELLDHRLFRKNRGLVNWGQ